MRKAMEERRKNYFGHERPRLATRVDVRIERVDDKGVSTYGPWETGIMPVDPNRNPRIEKEESRG